MGRSQKQWKEASVQGNRGAHVYIPKEDLRRLERQGVLDLDEDIQYNVSTGVSDGRARAFLQLRNADGDDAAE